MRSPTPPASRAELEESMGTILIRAFRDPSYTLIFLGFFSCGYQLAFVTAHFPAFVTELCGPIQPGGVLHSMGITTTSALGAVSISLIGLMNIVGTLTAGWAGNRWSKKYLLAGIYTGRTIIAALFIMFPITPTSVILFSAAMFAANSSKTSSFTSRRKIGSLSSVKSCATPRRRSAFPKSAKPPPMAIMLAEAKKAVPCRRLKMIWLSKMRGSRCTNWRIQSRRNSAMICEVEGKDLGAFSISRLHPTQQAINKPSPTASSAVNSDRRSIHSIIQNGLTTTTQRIAIAPKTLISLKMRR